MYSISIYYPSITEDLLEKSITFAKTHTDINDDTIKIIFNARKALLFSDNKVWVKQPGNSFDVTMGSFDGAEVCELVGLFLLDQLAEILGKENVGLYRDDGLAVIKNSSGPAIERIRKMIIWIFNEKQRRSIY